MAQRTRQLSDSELAPPHSLDAEQAVLGAILKDNHAINDVIEVIDVPGHFYVPKHQIIFDAALSLYRNNEPCDITTVVNELRRNDQLEKIGGAVISRGVGREHGFRGQC